MDDGLEITVQQRPMLDTGIGRELGFESDRVFLDAQARERRRLSPRVRAGLEGFGREIERRMLFGE